MIKKLVSEFTGSFILIFISYSAIILNNMGSNIGILGISLAVSFSYIFLIFIFGRLSGAHFNPLVSFGFFLTYRLKTKELIFYILAQLSGSLIAGIFCSIIYSTNILYAYPVFNQYIIANSDINAFYSILLIELIGSFILGILYSYRNNKSLIKNKYQALMIGFAVFILTLVFYNFDGALFNLLRLFSASLLNWKFENGLFYLISIPIGTISGFLLSYHLRKE